jgi:hypothetical protein
MPTKGPIPELIISKKLTNVSVDLEYVATIMSSLGLNEKSIRNSIVFIDHRPSLTILGSVWPKYLASLRFPRIKSSGSVIRLSSRLFFTGSTQRSINHTLVHEIEHAAQIQRRDLHLFVGYLTQVATSTAGIALGLTNQSNHFVFKYLIVTITGLFGLYIGYMFSLHEMQARHTSTSYKLTKNPIRFLTD